MTALAVLAVAGAAWILTMRQSQSMDAMAMGLGSVQSFAVSWVVMMSAIMLPSAIPFVLEFARNSERRRGWQVATGALGIAYMAVWLGFGVACYLAYTALRMPWPDQGLVGGAGLALAGLYSLTPVKRASQARCHELCALHGPPPFNLLRGAVVGGVKYGISCVGCSAALMIAMVVIGMSSLGWAVILSALVLAYKFVPPLALRHQLILALAIGALGVVYVVTA